MKNNYTANIRMEALENTCIVLTQKEYSRTASGKSWKTKPDTETTKRITAENYYNYCDSIPFFKRLGGSERAQFGYTYAGYLVTQITSISPDYTRKIVRQFLIVPDENTAKTIYKKEF